MPERPAQDLLGQVRRPTSGHKVRRLSCCAAVTALAFALGATIVSPPLPHLVWNVSASAPLGLYAVSPGAAITPGDMVIARVPARWRDLAARRRYIPINVPLVKRVAAGQGDRVCAIKGRIRINGRAVALQHRIDGRGRVMPHWRGCVTLPRGALFLLMDAPASFDGRYFGPINMGDVIGKAHLLWRA